MKKSILLTILLLSSSAVLADSITLTNATNMPAYFTVNMLTGPQGPFCVRPGKKVFADALTYRGMSAYLVDADGNTYTCHIGRGLREDLQTPGLYNHSVAITPCRIYCDGNQFQATTVPRSSIPRTVARTTCGTITMADNNAQLLQAPLLVSNRMAELLLKEGADPNTTDRLGNSPLFYAAQKNNVWMVKLLLENGSDPDLRNNAGKLPEDVTRSERIKELLRQYKKTRPTITTAPQETVLITLHQAARRGDTAMVQKLLNEGTDPNIKERTYDRGTALMHAAAIGSIPVATLLLERGADVNAKTTRGRSSLYYAALYDKADMVSLLLAQGADPNIVQPHTKRMIRLIQEQLKKLRAPEAPAAMTEEKQNLVRRLIAQYKELQALRAKRNAGDASPEEIARIDQQMAKIKTAAKVAGITGAAFIAGVVTGRLTKKATKKEGELPWSAPSPVYEDIATQTEPL